MPLRRGNTRTFHRTLFGGILETITLMKRGDDQQQGTVVSYVLFQCRRGLITKTGETLAGDMVSSHRTIWHIPRIELDRIGISYLNPLDQIVDSQGRTWQPESTTEIVDKLFENHLDVQCLRVK
jgi:hypothetical protein